MILRRIFFGWILLAGIAGIVSAETQRTGMGVSIEVAATIKPILGSNLGNVRGILELTNMGNQKVTVQHPGNVGAIIYLIRKEDGTILPSTLLEKGTPPFQSITLIPKETKRFEITNLNYVTTEGVMKFNFEPGRTYKVIVIYHSSGPNGSGFTSPEITLAFPK